MGKSCFWNNTHPTCAAVISAPGGGKATDCNPGTCDVVMVLRVLL